MQIAISVRKAHVMKLPS